jgi:hypothetical protein
MLMNMKILALSLGSLLMLSNPAGDGWVNPDLRSPLTNAKNGEISALKNEKSFHVKDVLKARPRKDTAFRLRITPKESNLDAGQKIIAAR